MSALATAATFLWLGMVLAISFLETPLKFRAPNVTPQIGLEIGRLVFRALNLVEIVLAIGIACAVFRAHDAFPPNAIVAYVAVFAALSVQMVAVRPILSRRSNQVLAGVNTARSRGHYAYVVLEVVKVIALAVAGTALLLHGAGY
ncbi:transmembrane protein [Mycobacteroides abscessus subsp. abscessus]|nr:transmembrane protein [Mycobacteroides abscessus subsp. abscessus]